MEKINLTPAPGVSEIIIREGEAMPPLKPNKSINITGTLSAPFLFLFGKKGLCPDINIHLKIYKDIGKLELVMGDQDPNTTHTIIGMLSGDKDLAKFGINTDKRFSVRDFIKFAKMMRYYFFDKTAHTVLIESLQKWSVRVEKVLIDHNDGKGNSNYQLETKVKEVEGFVGKFDLLIPIFQGYDKNKFTVEIGLDPKNSTVDLYLISDELYELEIFTRELILNNEVEKFNDFKFSKVIIS